MKIVLSPFIIQYSQRNISLHEVTLAMNDLHANLEVKKSLDNTSLFDSL
jgi:hypothetical protein